MVLNYIWIFFFLIAFAVAIFKWLVLGDAEIFGRLVTGVFDGAKNGFEISLGLTGVMTLWLGLMNVGEKAGVIGILTRLVSPFFSRLFPEVPRNHPAMGAMLMNFSANALGLDNAATPLGLKAMQGLQELNPDKETASNAQIMFLVLNTAGLTLIPVSVHGHPGAAGRGKPRRRVRAHPAGNVLRSAHGHRVSLHHPADQPVSPRGAVVPGGAGPDGDGHHLVLPFPAARPDRHRFHGRRRFIIITIIISFVGLALYRRHQRLRRLHRGAKEGFPVAIRIIPYLVAILVAIGAFRASGALGVVVDGLGLFDLGRWASTTDFVPALPVALMVPLSGSGARGMMVDVIYRPGSGFFRGPGFASTLGLYRNHLLHPGRVFRIGRREETRYA
jgi:spore maturation protein SpmA